MCGLQRQRQQQMKCHRFVSDKMAGDKLRKSKKERKSDSASHSNVTAYFKLLPTPSLSPPLSTFGFTTPLLLLLSMKPQINLQVVNAQRSKQWLKEEASKTSRRWRREWERRGRLAARGRTILVAQLGHGKTHWNVGNWYVYSFINAFRSAFRSFLFDSIKSTSCCASLPTVQECVCVCVFMYKYRHATIRCSIWLGSEKITFNFFAIKSSLFIASDGVDFLQLVGSIWRDR